MLNRNSHIPLYIQLKDVIKEEIRRNKYKAGHPLSTESELMHDFGVSRQTVRRAFDLLVQEGIVEKMQGLGSFVAYKKKTMGFEPLISLTYIFSNSGFRLKNKVLKSGLVEISEDLRREGFSGDNVFELIRLRYSKKQVAIYERLVFRESFADVIGDYDLTHSMGRLLSENLNIDIEKVSQDLIFERAGKDICEKLVVMEDEKVLSMRRKIYVQGDIEPYQYYEMWVNPSFSNIAFRNVFSK